MSWLPDWRLENGPWVNVVMFVSLQCAEGKKCVLACYMAGVLFVAGNLEQTHAHLYCFFITSHNQHDWNSVAGKCKQHNKLEDLSTVNNNPYKLSVITCLCRDMKIAVASTAASIYAWTAPGSFSVREISSPKNPCQLRCFINFKTALSKRFKQFDQWQLQNSICSNSIFISSKAFSCFLCRKVRNVYFELVKLPCRRELVHDGCHLYWGKKRWLRIKYGCVENWSLQTAHFTTHQFSMHGFPCRQFQSSSNWLWHRKLYAKRSIGVDCAKAKCTWNACLVYRLDLNA